MALRGNLKDFALSDVFQLIALSRKTGVLRMRRRDASHGSVWFREGDVFFAESNWRRERLGDRLVTARRITPAALAQAVRSRAAEPQGRRLGTILVEEGHISREVLEAFVREQILDTIFDLMRWEDGEFDFEVTHERPEEDIGLSASVENIAMESGRRLEEWERIKRKVPSTDIVFKMSTAPGEGPFEISLKPAEWNLLLLIDGTRSVAELALAAQMTDFDVARVVYGLFSAGLLEVVSDEDASRMRAEKESADVVSAERAALSVAAPEPAIATEPMIAPEPGGAVGFLVDYGTPVPAPDQVPQGPGITELGIRYERVREASDQTTQYGEGGFAAGLEVEEYPPWPPVQTPLVESSETELQPYVEPAAHPSPPQTGLEDVQSEGVSFVEESDLSTSYEDVDVEHLQVELGVIEEARLGVVEPEPAPDGGPTLEVEAAPEVAAPETAFAPEAESAPEMPLDTDLTALGLAEDSALAPAEDTLEEASEAERIGYEEPPETAVPQTLVEPIVAEERAEEAAGSQAPAAAPVEGEEPQASLDVRIDLEESSAISEEITELTGVGRATVPAPGTTSAPQTDEEGPRGAVVDRQTLLGIIEGIKRL